MKPSLRQQLERLALRLSELDATLADPAIAADMKRYREVSREHAEAAGLVELFRRFESRERRILEEQVEDALAAQERHLLHLAIVDAEKRSGGIENVLDDRSGKPFDRQQMDELVVAVELGVAASDEHDVSSESRS
jgi:peptide chain release factor 1